MADRYPLIANPATSQIQELASGDNIDLTGNDIVGVKDITATGTISTTGQISAGGISYPTTTGNDGQVLTSDGAGGSAWEDSSVSGLPSGDAGESIVFDGNNWVLSPPNFAVETTASDPDWNSVTMLIPFDEESGTPGTASWSTPVYGSVAGTDYVSAGVSTAITSVGTVELDDRAPGVQRIKFGTGAGRFQGSDTGYMEFGGTNAGNLYNLGSGDFTLEFWFLLDNLDDDQKLVSVDSTHASYDAGCWYIRVNTNGTMSFWDHYTATHHYIEANAGGGGIQADTWYHCAISRINNELRGYLNGIKEFEATVDTNYTTDANSIAYGARLRLGFGDSNDTNGMNGNLDDFRITIGTGRYDSANFTPPTQGFATTATPTYGNVTYPLTLHTDVDLVTNPPTNGQVFTWDATGGSGNNGAWVPTTISGGGTTTFVGLTDTPVGFTADKWLKVNSAGNGLEWTDAPSGATTDTIEEGNSSVEVTDSGTDGTIQFTTDGTARWKITNGGHILPNANASFDIGSAEYKVRHLFLSDNSLKFVNSSNVSKSLSVDDTTGQLQFEGKDILQNVVLTSLDNDQILKYNGTNWVNAAPTAGGGSITINNNADNRLITASGTSVLNGEANLTYDGTDLTCGGKVEDSKGDVRSLGGSTVLSAAYTIVDRSYVGTTMFTDSNVTIDSGLLDQGDAITIMNTSGSSTQIIAGTNVELYIAGATTAWTPMNLAAHGIATIMCFDTNGTKFVIMGAGVST